MSLVADYSSDTSDTDSDDIERDIIKTEVKNESSECKTTLPNIKLPVPDFDKTKGSIEIKTSVFTNPFLEDENAKEAMLQKHVKMVNKKDAVVINGKKICWNYRKGRCRFGHNCKYAHDSDIQKTSEQLDAEKETSIAQSVICQKVATGQNFTQPQPSQQEIDKINEESEEKNQRRKRPGLTPGLVPGKKVMKQYLKHKS